MTISIKTNDMVKILEGDCKGQYGHVKDTSLTNEGTMLLAWVFLPNWERNITV